MVSIENAESHVLAYSASNDEADDLRRLSILGRAGPPEHLKWIGQWGIFDACRPALTWCASPSVRNWASAAAGDRNPSASCRCAPATGVRRLHLGAAGSTHG